MRSVEQHLEAVLADVSPLESLEVGLLGAVGVAAFLRRRTKPIKFTRPGSFDSEE